MASGDALSCNVCYTPFNQTDRRPWDIGCGHCFCEKCLRQSPSSFRHCPECRARASNPHVSIALLRMVADADAAPGSGGRARGGAAAAAPAAGDGGGHTGGDSPGAGRPGREPEAVRRRYAGAGAGAARAAAGGSAAALAAAAGVQGASAAVQRLMRNDGGQFSGHQQQLQEFKSSVWVWLTPLLGLLYALSPLDLIPDVIPVVGWMDDLLVLAYVAYTVWVNTQRAAARNRMRL